MANKIRAFPEINLAVPAIVVTADLPHGTLLKITDDRTVDKSVAEDDFLVGSLEVPVREANTQGTMRSRYRALVTMRCSGAIAAGERVKAGPAAAGVQTLKKWAAGVENEQLIVGVCWVGAADAAEGEFLIF